MPSGFHMEETFDPTLGIFDPFKIDLLHRLMIDQSLDERKGTWGDAVSIRAIDRYDTDPSQSTKIRKFRSLGVRGCLCD